MSADIANELNIRFYDSIIRIWEIVRSTSQTFTTEHDIITLLPNLMIESELFWSKFTILKDIMSYKFASRQFPAPCSSNPTLTNTATSTQQTCFCEKNISKKP